MSYVKNQRAKNVTVRMLNDVQLSFCKRRKKIDNPMHLEGYNSQVAISKREFSTIVDYR